jgi:Tol biopolymer transport system component
MRPPVGGRLRRPGAASTIASLAVTLTIVAIAVVWRGNVDEGTPVAAASHDAIVFTSQSPTDRSVNIAIMRKAGREPRFVGSGHSPAWSPDGRLIAFVAIGPDRSEIAVMNADGSGVRRLTTNRHGVFDEEPTWSPDGRTIVFSRVVLDLSGPDPLPADRNHRDVYSIALDGSGERKLIGGPTDDFSPAWSPDGRQLGFVRWIDPASAPDSLPQIWMMRSEERRMRRLTEHEDGVFRFDWAPDGSEIAFGGACRLFTIRVDGGKPQRVRISSAGWNDDEMCPFDPSWTQDGERILFVAGPDDDHDIYLVRTDGTDLERFTRPGVTDNEPDWRSA